MKLLVSNLAQLSYGKHIVILQTLPLSAWVEHPLYQFTQLCVPAWKSLAFMRSIFKENLLGNKLFQVLDNVVFIAMTIIISSYINSIIYIV